MHKAKLYAVAVAAALLSACSGGAQMVPANHALQPSADRELTTLSTFVARDNATGTLLHILPPQDVFSAHQLSSERTVRAGGNLLYGGGPVQTAPKIYVVFWGSAWNGSGDPNGVKNQLINFYNVIGGSRWLNSVSQYTQSNGQHVGNSGNILGGYYVDTTSSPPSRPTQSQMAAEAAKAAAHFGAQGLNVGSYVVAMPHGIAPSGFKTQYCAYHSTTSAGGTTIAWTNLPYMPDAGTSCGAGSVNSPGTLDGVTIVGGHEQGETETDPNASSGWIDSAGAENGDKCAWTNLYNNSAAGGYPTQPLWSNSNNGCVQSY